MKSIKKTISILLIHAFLLSGLPLGAPQALAATPDKSTVIKEVTTNPDGIIISKDNGLVKSKYTGNKEKLIVHIQDAHCNYEAQTNIANIIEGLIKNSGLAFVSVEGADGLIDTSWFKAFPDAEVRKEVANYFMKKGEITGPEFLSITTDYPFKLFGAETREYYIENLNAFTSSYPLKDETEKYLNSIKSVLNRLKDFIYNADLKAMDQKSRDYESKTLQFNEYIRFLQAEAEKYKINLRQYDNLFKLVNVLIYEKKIDFSVTDKERSALIDELSKMVAKDVLTELVNKSIEFKVGKISSVEYYNFVRELAVKNNIVIIEKYPNLYNYIIYNSVYSKIDNEKLFSDIKKLETAIKEKIFENDDQRTLERLSRHIDTLVGLINIKLLNDEFDYFKAHKEEFAPEVFMDFMKAKSIQFGLAYEIVPPSDAVADSISKLEDFYAIAIKRDKALVDNTLRGMEKEGQKIAVLVTGGFHSEGMTKLLQKEGVSYIVVCPNITKDVPTPYIKVLMNQRTTFEEILVGAQEPAKHNLLAPVDRTWTSMMSDEEYAELIEHCSTLKGGTVEDFKSIWIEAYVGVWLNKRLGFVSKDRMADRNTFERAFEMDFRHSSAKARISDEAYLETLGKAIGSDAFEKAFTSLSSEPRVGVTPSQPAPELAADMAMNKAFVSTDVLQFSHRENIEQVAKIFGLDPWQKQYLEQEYARYVLRTVGAPGISIPPEMMLLPPAKIMTDRSMVMDGAAPDGYDDVRDGNFILDCTLNDNERDKVIGLHSYEDILKEHAKEGSLDKIVITFNDLYAGIGENVMREKFNAKIADIMGLKGADRDRYIKMKAKPVDLGRFIVRNGKLVFVSVAEIKLLRLIKAVKDKKYAGINLELLVNRESDPSIDDLLNKTACLLGRFDKTSEYYGMTYGRVLEKLKVNVLPRVVQNYLPGINRETGMLCLDNKEPKHPGGHGAFGLRFLLETAFGKKPDPDERHVRVFGNGEDINAHADKAIIDAMIRNKWAVVKLVTQKTPIDTKGGVEGARVMRRPDGRIKLVSDQLERADAETAGQLELFEKGGLPGGLGQDPVTGKMRPQLFNTNVFYINTSLLHDIFQDLINQQIVTREQLADIVTPTLLDKVSKIGTDDRTEYAMIDTAIGTAMTNLNTYFAMSEDPRVEGILSKYGIDRILHLVNVPREFFTPMKFMHDAAYVTLSNAYEFKLDDEELMIRQKVDVLPDLDCQAKGPDGKEAFWDDVESYSEYLFIGSDVRKLTSLKVRGAIDLSQTTLIGDIKIYNETGRPVSKKDLQELAKESLIEGLSVDEHKKVVMDNAAIRLIGDGRGGIKAVSVKISEQGAITTNASGELTVPQKIEVHSKIQEAFASPGTVRAEKRVRTIGSGADAVEIYMIPGLEECAYLVAHPGRGGDAWNSSKRRIYMSPSRLDWYNSLNAGARKQFEEHEIAHIDNPGLTEYEILFGTLNEDGTYKTKPAPIDLVLAEAIRIDMNQKMGKVSIREVLDQLNGYFEIQLKDLLSEYGSNVNWAIERMRRSTAGTRGILDPDDILGGPQLNAAVVIVMAQGYADYINANFPEERRAAFVGFDPRYWSLEYAQLFTRVLLANNIKVYRDIGGKPTQTPVASYMAYALNLACGVEITSSHNPPNQNGIKSMTWYGGVDTDDVSAKIASSVQRLYDMGMRGEGVVKIGLYDDPLRVEIDAKKIYYDRYMSRLFDEETVRMMRTAMDSGARFIFDGLHGVGGPSMKYYLDEIFGGYDWKSKIILMNEVPDSSIGGIDRPDPSNPATLEKSGALERLTKEKGVLIAVTADMDADRIGTAVIIPENDVARAKRYGLFVTQMKFEGKPVNIVRFTPNQIFTLISYERALQAYAKYGLKTPEAIKEAVQEGAVPMPYLLTTIPSSLIAKQMIEAFGGKAILTTVGFKNLGYEAQQLDDEEGFKALAEEKRMLEMGNPNKIVVSLLEESGGANIGPFTKDENGAGIHRDKDTIALALSLFSTASRLKMENKNVLDLYIEMAEKLGGLFYYERIDAYLPSQKKAESLDINIQKEAEEKKQELIGLYRAIDHVKEPDAAASNLDNPENVKTLVGLFGKNVEDISKTEDLEVRNTVLLVGEGDDWKHIKPVARRFTFKNGEAIEVFHTGREDQEGPSISLYDSKGQFKARALLRASGTESLIRVYLEIFEPQESPRPEHIYKYFRPLLKYIGLDQYGIKDEGARYPEEFENNVNTKYGIVTLPQSIDYNPGEAASADAGELRKVLEQLTPGASICSFYIAGSWVPEVQYLNPPNHGYEQEKNVHDELGKLNLSPADLFAALRYLTLSKEIMAEQRGNALAFLMPNPKSEIDESRAADMAMKKTGVSEAAVAAEEYRISEKKDALESTLKQFELLKKIEGSFLDNKAVVILHDTNGDDAANNVAIEAEKVLRQYLGKDAIWVVRDEGEKLVENGISKYNEFVSKKGRENVAFIVMTGTDKTSITGATLDKLRVAIKNQNKSRTPGDASLPASVMLQVDERDGYMSYVDLYNIAVTIGFNLDARQISAYLNTIASAANGDMFTPDAVMDQIRKGFLVLRPIKPIDIKDIENIRKADLLAMKSL